jgi:hypothetical protein
MTRIHQQFEGCTTIIVQYLNLKRRRKYLPRRNSHASGEMRQQPAASRRGQVCSSAAKEKVRDNDDRGSGCSHDDSSHRGGRDSGGGPRHDR